MKKAKYLGNSKVFYTILGFDKYAINNDGEIRLVETGEVIKHEIINNTPYVTLTSTTGKTGKISVAKLVLYVKVGNVDAPIIFKDGDKRNVHSSNLAYRIDDVFKNGENFIINGITFKPAFGDPSTGYYVSRDGIIYSLSRRKLMQKRYRDQFTYMHINLHINGKLIEYQVHRLVYETWGGVIPEGYVIDHKDGKKFNNDISNLEPVTRAENTHRAYANGLANQAWNDYQVHLVCQCIIKGMVTSQIVRALGLEETKRNRDRVQCLIYDLKKGRIRRDITSKYDLENISEEDKKLNISKTQYALSDYEVHDICKKIDSGMGDTAIHRIYDKVSMGTIYNIRRGRTYREIGMLYEFSNNWSGEFKKVA